jgi:cytochrome P450
VGHLVSSLPLAREVLTSPERFAKTGPGALSDSLTGVMGRSALVNMDGEAHRRLRGKLQALFTPAGAAALVQSVLGPALGLLGERLRRGERVDLAREAQAMTGRVACALLGVPLPPGREDATCIELHRLGAEFASVLTLGGGRPDARRLAEAAAQFARLTQFAREAFDRGDERCVPGRLRALGLDFEECRGVIGLLLLAGTETTASALPRIVAMLVDTGQWSRLRAQRALMAAALDEGLRLTAAVPLMTRNVVAPTTLGGRTLGRDDRVIVLLYNVLRSHEMGGEPSWFDLGRERAVAGPPLWFGQGPHFCLGAALARQEIEAALTALLEAGDLAIVLRDHRSQGPLPGYGRLLVELAPAAARTPAAASASPPAAMNDARSRTGR